MEFFAACVVNPLRSICCVKGFLLSGCWDSARDAFSFCGSVVGALQVKF